MRYGGLGQMPAKDHSAGTRVSVVAGREHFWGKLVAAISRLSLCMGRLGDSANGALF